MRNPIAFLQWKDSNAVHLLDLSTTGSAVETRHSHAWQESLNTFLAGNEGVDTGTIQHIFVSDDGIAHRVDLDGLDKPIEYPAGLTFRPYMYREFPDADLAIVGGFDDVLAVEKLAFVKLSTNAILREKQGQEQQGTTRTYINWMNLFYPTHGAVFAGQAVLVVGPINNEAKLLRYDPVTDTKVFENLTGASGDMQYGECWMLRVFQYVYNPNKPLSLYVVPKRAYKTLQNPPLQNFFQFDGSFNVMSKNLSELSSLPSSLFGSDAVVNTASLTDGTGNAALFAQSGEPVMGGFVHYFSQCDAIGQGAVLMLDLGNAISNSFALGAIPEADLVTTIDQIDASSTLAKVVALGDRVVARIFSLVVTKQGRKIPMGRAYLYDPADILTGSVDYARYEGFAPFVIDSHSEAELDNVQLLLATPHVVEGTVFVKTTPVSTSIDMQDEDSGVIIARASSDSDGRYSFRCYTPRPKTTIAMHPISKRRNGAVSLVPVEEYVLAPSNGGNVAM